MLITERYEKDILGTLSCYDRVVCFATPGKLGYSGGMTDFFYQHNYKIFDFHKIFEPVTEAIKQNAERMAEENGLAIEYIRKTGAFRKEDRIQEVIKARGDHEGLVHIFSALEVSNTFSPWHNKETGKTYFKPDQTKCLHYYFYFIDRELGLCFFKVPTTAPFKATIYFNGHNLLEGRLKKKGIAYEKRDNAFTYISDFAEAQRISDAIRVEDIHGAFDIFAARYLPLPGDWKLPLNYTIRQVEYAFDVAFKSPEALGPLYGNIIKTAMHTVTPEDIANFLGKKFSVRYGGEMGSAYNKRILGTRIKHQMGEISVKIYDRFGSVLRIEVTSNDVSQLKVYREVPKRDGTTVSKVANAKKSIYSLYPLTQVFKNATRRYLEFVSAFNDPTDGLKKLDKVVESITVNERNYKGFNFFGKEDSKILEAVANGRFTLKGITNKGLRKLLPKKSQGQISRILKRLRLHGLIKKVAKTYRYYLTSLGRQIIAAGLAFKSLALIPKLAKSSLPASG
jgi:DNA-binding HxlR family transcriptional regulator